MSAPSASHTQLLSRNIRHNVDIAKLSLFLIRNKQSMMLRFEIGEVAVKSIMWRLFRFKTTRKVTRACFVKIGAQITLWCRGPNADGFWFELELLEPPGKLILGQRFSMVALAPWPILHIHKRAHKVFAAYAVAKLALVRESVADID